MIQISRRIVSIDISSCSGCGVCESHCRRGALKRGADGKATLVDDHLCDGLGTCVDVCPSGALSIEKRPAFVGVDCERPPDAAQQQGDPMFQWRLSLCCRASACGRLCTRLVKGPGKANVYCVDVRGGTRRNLYEALADPAFVCPDGVF